MKLSEPTFAVYAYGEMELGKADDQKDAAKPRHTEQVDATQEDEK